MIKRIYLTLLLTGFLISSCQKKPVQLPLIDIPGLSEIQNHSSVWIFMEDQNGESIAKLNKNNKILNTHWIFNIDKRLSMGQVIPLLQEMQENRNKDSMHKKEGMNNYFSYANTATKKISLSPFPQTTFISTETNSIDKKDDACVYQLEIWGDQIRLEHEAILLDQLLFALENLDDCRPEEKRKVLLIYDAETTYQDYLRTKVFLHQTGIACDSIEYVFNVK